MANKAIVLIFLCVSFLDHVVSRSSNNLISTVIGGGTGSTGDSITSVNLVTPMACFGDTVGNMYTTEFSYYCTRKYNLNDPDQIYYAFLGVCGSYGYTGEGGPATSAKFTYNSGITMDTAGKFYATDGYNARVRVVSTAGIVSTFVGGGGGTYNVAGTSADINNPAGLWSDSVSNIYISTYGSRVVAKMNNNNIITLVAGGKTGFSGDGGPATSAGMGFTYGVKGDTTGLLYVMDSGNNVVRTVTTSGIINTFAGQNSVSSYVSENIAATSAGFSVPYDAFLDSATNDIYISSQYLHRLFVVTKTTNIISTYAGSSSSSGFSGDDGRPTSAKFNQPCALFITTTGQMFLPDSGNNRVRKIYDISPSTSPTFAPTVLPTSSAPSIAPSCSPTVVPTTEPSIEPSVEPSVRPSQPTSQPSSMPSVSNATNTEFLLKSPGFEVGNLFAFAGLHSDGSVSAWGSSDYGGSIASVSDKLNGDIPVIKIVSSKTAFAALRSDGSVVAWGRSASITGWEAYESYTTINSLVGSEQAFAGVTSDGSVIAFGADCCGGNVDQYGWVSYLQCGVVSVTASSGAFAALKSDGTVFTWGNEFAGGGVSNLTLSSLTGIVQIAATQGAFAALTDNGDVVVWGDRSSGGSMSSSVSALLSRRVVGITSNWAAFAAHTVSLGVIAWGQSSNGGDYSKVKGKLAYSVKSVSVTHSAFAALKTNGSVVAWGNSKSGGDSSSVSSQLSSVTNVYGNTGAFAAVTSSGGVVAWGDSKSGGSMYSNVSSHLTSGVEAVYHTDLAFIAVKSDGSAVVWGNSHYGGSASDAVSSYLSSNVRLVCTCGQAFTVILRNGTVVSWGNSKSISSAGLQQGMNYSSITSC